MTKLELLINFITENAQNLICYAIHCNTPEKAKDLIGMLYSLGFRWEDDNAENSHFEENGSVTTKWNEKGKNTCYSVTSNKIILFGKRSFYESQGKTVYDYDEVFGEAEDIDSFVDETSLKESFNPTTDIDTIINDTQKLNDSITNTEEVVEVVMLNSKKCPNCDNELNNDGKKFCMECGFKIPEGFFEEKITREVPIVVPNNIDSFEETSEKKSSSLSKTKKQLIIIASIFIFIILLVVIVKIIQSLTPNNFGLFSSIWESVFINVINHLEVLYG